MKLCPLSQVRANRDEAEMSGAAGPPNEYLLYMLEHAHTVKSAVLLFAPIHLFFPFGFFSAWLLKATVFVAHEYVHISLGSMCMVRSLGEQRLLPGVEHLHHRQLQVLRRRAVRAFVP